MIAAMFLPLVLALIIGVIASFAVQGFIAFIGLSSRYLRGDGELFLGLPSEILIIAGPVIAGLIVGIILKLTSIKRWHGPPDSILAAHSPNARPDTEAGLISTLASAVSLAGGASVGLYGPLVHFGGVIGDYISKLTKDQTAPHILLACGSAAAISSGFGAPFAGLIFAHEVILRHMAVKAFAPILVATVTAHTVSKEFWSSEPLFQASIGGISDFSELFALAALGVLSGLIASLYMRGLTGPLPIPKKIPTFLLPAIAGLFCGLVGLFLPQVLGLGTETIRSMIAGEGSISLWILLLFAKLILTVICIRFNMFGGVFSPALFIGVALGCLAASLFSIILPNSNPSLFAIAGMAAVTGSVIGGPISTVLIVFELTTDYQVALGAGVSVCFANLVSSKIYGHSAFDQILINRGINIHMGRDKLKLVAMKVLSFSRKDFIRLVPEHTVSQMISILAKSGNSEGYIVDPKGVLLGKVSLSDLNLSKRQNDPPSKSLIKKFLYLEKDTNALEAIDTIKDFVGESVPILDKTNNQIIGVITESDLFNALLSAESERNKEELGE